MSRLNSDERLRRDSSIWSVPDQRAVSAVLMRGGLHATWDELLRLIRFGFVGIGVTVVYAVVTFLIRWSGLTGSIPASIVGHVIAAVLSYFGHLHISFAVEPNHRVFLGRFVVVGAATFALNILLTWTLVSVFHTAYQVPIVVVSIAIPAVNYFFNRFWVFHPNLNSTSGKSS